MSESRTSDKNGVLAVRYADQCFCYHSNGGEENK